jgi:hypothetical protein
VSALEAVETEEPRYTLEEAAELLGLEPPKLLTLQEAAARLSVDPRWLAAESKAGRLPWVDLLISTRRQGGKVTRRYAAPVLAKYIAERTVDAG